MVEEDPSEKTKEVKATCFQKFSIIQMLASMLLSIEARCRPSGERRTVSSSAPVLLPQDVRVPLHIHAQESGSSLYRMGNK